MRSEASSIVNTLWRPPLTIFFSCLHATPFCVLRACRYLSTLSGREPRTPESSALCTAEVRMSTFAVRMWMLSAALQVTAGCGTTTAIDASCCTVVTSTEVESPTRTTTTPGITLNTAGTAYEKSGWELYFDSSSSEWKYEQCSSGLTASISDTAVCPNALPQTAWSFSAGWGSSEPAAGTYYTFACEGIPPPPAAATGILIGAIAGGVLLIALVGGICFMKTRKKKGAAKPASSGTATV